MTRLRLDLAYDGAAFHGWAEQQGLRTVQGELQRWIQLVLRLHDPVRLVCAGRTDAGVHARGQVAHVDLPDADPELVDQLSRRLRRVLPADLVVRSAALAPDGFDARFSATWRRYVYRLTDRVPSPLDRFQVVAWPRPLDETTMAAAGAALLGLHDFVAYCRRREGASTIRRLQRLDVARIEDRLEITVVADAFCHSMVRSLVGALVRVGEGAQPAGWPASLLERTSRAGDLTVMPPHGLVLEEVGYPPDGELAERAAQSKTRRTADELAR